MRSIYNPKTLLGVAAALACLLASVNVLGQSTGYTAGDCWNDSTKQVVDSTAQSMQVCEGKDYCVSDELKCEIALAPSHCEGANYRTLKSRVQTGSCGGNESGVSCDKCPDGSVRICAIVHHATEKDLDGNCVNFCSQQDIVLHGNCI